MKKSHPKILRHAIAASFVALVLAGASTALVPAMAQVPAAALQTAPPATDLAALSEGEITRWDARTLRVTLRHGEIKNLEMPPMTMVFRVQDAGVLGDLKTGDKVRFRAEQVSGAYHVTRIEKAP